MLPSSSVLEAVQACVRRKVRSAVIFAAGFSEVGSDGIIAQTAVSDAANAGELTLLGPNCLGYSNLVDGIPVTFIPTSDEKQSRFSGADGFAVLGQSGLLLAHIRGALEARKLRTSYFVTTGNEAGLGIADFVDFFADDACTRAIIVFAEHVRFPTTFLNATAKARAAGKSIIMLHTGKSELAKAAARSHTGALAGNYSAMRVALECAGIAMVDTLEEIVDVAELLMRFSQAPTKGVGIVTFSGAFCGQAHDYCSEIGLDIPTMSPAVADELRPILPGFATIANPLDLTTQPAWQPDLLGIGTKALLDDPAVGSVVIATPIGTSAEVMPYLDGLLPRLAGSSKPIVFGAMTDGRVLPTEFSERVSEARLLVIQSPERALRAIAKMTAHGRRLAEIQLASPPSAFSGLPTLGRGNQPRWLVKELLGAIGLRVPHGSLAHSISEARSIAGRVGYPVVLKAQSNELWDETDAGDLIVLSQDEAKLDQSWARLHADVRVVMPRASLDGVLVEQAPAKGLELKVSGLRDPNWGPFVLVGLVGNSARVNGDMRQMPANLTAESIAVQLQKLKSAKLPNGVSEVPERDVQAAASVASLVGRLMLTETTIREIDLYPVVVYAEGASAMVIDARIITDCGHHV
jgi:acyl-CoA synthetase (NDP forming)